MSESDHWAYVALAYGATFVIVAVVVWRIVGEHSRLIAELAELADDGDEK